MRYSCMPYNMCSENENKFNTPQVTQDSINQDTPCLHVRNQLWQLIKTAYYICMQDHMQNHSVTD
jgi:hypothetical protein